MTNQPPYGAPPQAAPGHAAPAYGQPVGGAPIQGMGGPGHGPGAADKASQAKGFFRSLFDFSFENFVSPNVLRVLYGFYLAMIIPAFFMLLFVWYQALTHTSFMDDSWDPQFGLFCMSSISFPIGVFLYILLGRVLFERGILAFRQHALTIEIRDALKQPS